MPEQDKLLPVYTTESVLRSFTGHEHPVIGLHNVVVELQLHLSLFFYLIIYFYFYPKWFIAA